MASIADIFLRALLEDKQLQVDAQKAGDKAGATMGERMSKGISVALRAGLGLVSAGAAIATKGLVELDDTMAQFTADTGLAGDEAERARKSILAMSSRNIQPMKEIGAVLGKVHTDLGLTGEAADAAAEDFLRFARVTGRDAAEEVSAFDDILDAWNLTADQSQAIMDKLVVSHQKYGGAIADDEAALASMAPQLKALNLTLDDGIALLDLFKSSGLDAAQIPRALNSAVQKLDGKPLKDFITELAGIEDPGKRAQRAIEIFGAKAGVALANAIKPGMKSLDDFKISTEEATGATEKARDAIDSTWGNRAQLLLKGFTTKLTELGSAFGPLLTGIASIASLGGALGLDKFAVEFAKKMAQAGKAGGESLIDGVQTATGAAGTIIGNFFASRIEAVLDATKQTRIGQAAVRAGAVLGALWSASFAAAAKIGAALAAVFVKLPGVSALRSAVLASSIKIGTLSGTAMGTAAGLGLKLGILGVVATIAMEIEPTTTKAGQDIGRALYNAIGLTPPNLHPERWGWPLGPAESDASRWFFGLLPESIRQGAMDAFGIIPATAEHAMADLSNFPGKVADDLAGGASVVADGAATLAAGIPDEMGAAQREATAIAKATPYEIAKSLQEGADPVTMAAELLKDAIKNAISPSKEIATLEGELAGKDLAKALHSKKPEVRAAAQAYKAAIEERLFALKNNVPAIALSTGQTYSDTLEKKKTQVARAAQALITSARAKFIAFKAEAGDYGWNTGDSYADRFAAALKAGLPAVTAALRAYKAGVIAGSPPKAGAVLYGIDKWGAATGAAYVDPLVMQLQRGVAAMRETLRGALNVSMGTPAFAMAGMGAVSPVGVGAVSVSGASGGGGLVINGGIHVNVKGGATNAETGQAVRQGVHDAMADVLRQQTARLPTGTRS